MPISNSKLKDLAVVDDLDEGEVTEVHVGSKVPDVHVSGKAPFSIRDARVSADVTVHVQT